MDNRSNSQIANQQTRPAKLNSVSQSKIALLSRVALIMIVALSSELLLHGIAIGQSLLNPIGRVVVVSILIYILHRFATSALKEYEPSLKDLITLSVLLIASLFMISAGRIIAISLISYLQRFESSTLRELSSLVDHSSLLLSIPFASPGILIQSVLGLQCGLLAAVALALILGIYFTSEPLLVTFVFTSTLVGCLSMVEFRSRKAYVKAGLNIATIGLVFALCSVVIESNFSPTTLALRVLSALLGGMLCSFIIAGIAPVLEYLGGYATDMTLIELATLDHPLLKELSIHAPGTWNHSMVMGMMAESAADSIGANPIVSRVGAYFHDVGKLKNPLYFVENQAPGENRHDKLSPSMSALIIRSHVKDGIKLARQHKLPLVLEDMIPQHHGTALIEFFYEKACKEAQESDQANEVDQTLYTYPGPRPQTKEAGILMLADGIEAACRTISEPTLDRIQGLVQKMVNKVFASGELNECELTLKELHSIAKAFTRVLGGIYHQRVAYSEPAEKVNEKEREREKQSEETQESPGKEDLKRLGL
jgi:putative nucleotidyltransferase with HDIG domain